MIVCRTMESDSQLFGATPYCVRDISHRGGLEVLLQLEPTGVVWRCYCNSNLCNTHEI